MYDLHCHILPGIDDGANTIEDSLALIKASIAQGVTHIVATPHIRFGRFNNNVKKIEDAFQILQNAIKDESIQISTAAEVHICPEIMMLAQKKQLPFLGKWDNKDLLLLELPNDQIPAGTDKLIKWLDQHNIKVMIAHPERYKPFQKREVLLDEYAKMGCLFQLTAGALLGDMGTNAKEFAHKWLLEKRFCIMATDAHNLERRAPKLKEAFDVVVDLVGEQYANQLCIGHPKQISASKFDE